MRHVSGELRLLAAALAAVTLSLAQSGRSSITGIVTDNTAGVISGVEVVAVEKATQWRTISQTNTAGVYVLANLAVGTYTVSFRKTGMKSAEREGITLALAQVAQLNLSLEVGPVSESITVRAQTPVLDTETSDVGAGAPNRSIVNLPLPISGGRQLESFAYAIVPGVEGNAWTSYINGGPAFSKEVLIEGTSAVVQIGGDIEASRPSLESVEEFKVEASGMTAEYGRTGGGVFLYSLKSGTNQFHGSAVAFLRNEALNANSWNNNFLMGSDPTHAADYQRPRDRQWTDAFSAGGPAIKNRTFVFGAFERFVQEQLALGGFRSTVPVPAFLDGDFSALLDRTAAPLGKDAAGNAVYPGAIIDPSSGVVFPGNVIPAARLSSLSKKIADIYRQSYQPQVAGRLVNNNALPASNNPWFHTSQFSVKADHTVSARNRIATSFIVTGLPRVLVDAGGIWDPHDYSHTGGPLSKSRMQDVTTRSYRLSDTHAFSPRVVNVATLTYGRYRNASTASAAGGDWPSKLGLGGGAGNFPEIDFGNAVNGVGTSAIGYGISGYYVANAYLIDESLAWSKGRHNLKFGLNGRLMQMNSHSPASPVDSFSFSNNQTGAPQQSWANRVGFGFASFMLGAVQNASQDVPVDLYGRRKYLSLFAQDDWRVTPRLVLNLGLRWEATMPLTEKYGHWGNFEYALKNSDLGIPGALAFAGNGSTSFERRRDWKDFGPRVGMAYQVNSRAVIRAAYGIFYEPIGLNFWSGVPYGFAPGFQGINRVNKTADLSPAFYWDRGYPGRTVLGVQDPNLVQYPMVRVDPRALFAGYIQQWNGGVEFQAGRSTRFGIGYVGNRGSRLHSDQFERNQPDASAVTSVLRSGNEWTWVYDAGSAASAGVRYPYPGFGNFAWVALAPYPQIAAAYSPLMVLSVPKGSSDYHALDATVSRRGSSGLSMELGYTLSRGRGNAGSAFEENWWNGDIQDVTKLSDAAHMILPYDATHIVKGYVAYELPFGKGRSRLVKALAGGWTVTSIVRYQSGAPLRVISDNFYQVWSANIYANASANGDFSRHFDGSSFDAAHAGPASNRYFDPSGYSNPAYGDFGSALPYRSELRGFGIASEDASLLKTFTITERCRLQLRAEFTNVFNRHSFENPDTDINSKTFGQVKSVSGAPRNGQVGIRLDW